jgi:hypothetical protein
MDATAPSTPVAAPLPAADPLERSGAPSVLAERLPAGIETLAARVAVELLSGLVRSRVRPGLAPGLVGHVLLLAISLGLTL